MATYKVQGPDGAIHLFQGPDGASPDQVVSIAQQQFGSPSPQTQPTSQSPQSSSDGGGIMGFLKGLVAPAATAATQELDKFSGTKLGHALGQQSVGDILASGASKDKAAQQSKKEAILGKQLTPLQQVGAWGSEALNIAAPLAGSAEKAAGEALTKAFPNIAKATTDIGSTLSKSGKVGKATADIAAKVPKIAVQAAGGGVQNATNTLQSGGSVKDAEKSLKSGSSVSALIASGFEGASLAKNMARSVLGKTAVGQLFGNASKDTTAGLFGKNAASNSNSDYNKLLSEADKNHPNGIPGTPIAKNVEKLLGGDPTATDPVANNGFGIQGSGPAGLHAVHPEDLHVMQGVIDAATGGTVFKNAAEKEAFAYHAAELAKAYGVGTTTKMTTSSLEKTIAKGMQSGSNRFRGSIGDNTDNTIKSLAKAFQPIVDNGGHMPLDFTNSKLANLTDKQQQINTLWQDIGRTTSGKNSNNGTNTVKNLDMLKQRIDQLYSHNPTNKSDETVNAIVAGMRDAVSSALKESSPAYAKAMEAAQGSIAGGKFSRVLPPKIAQMFEGGGAIAATMLHPAALPALAAGAVATSPRVAGSVIRGAGAVNRLAGKATVPVSNTVRKSPAGQTAIMKLLNSLGIRP